VRREVRNRAACAFEPRSIESYGEFTGCSTRTYGRRDIASLLPGTACDDGAAHGASIVGVTPGRIRRCCCSCGSRLAVQSVIEKFIEGLENCVSVVARF
jgi:hypothetical protein